MFKRTFLLLLIISVFFLSGITPASALELNEGNACTTGVDICCSSSARPCFNDGSVQCLPETVNGVTITTCQKSPVGKIFGFIQAPAPLLNLLKNDPTGAGAISQFLSNGIVLIYSLASIVLIFMLLWGAFDWMTSGGDKERIAAAQRKIINAVIGIILFAVAFAVIQVLGTFTGFKFFKGQNVQVTRDAAGIIQSAICPDGVKLVPVVRTSDPDVACRGHGT